MHFKSFMTIEKNEMEGGREKKNETEYGVKVARMNKVAIENKMKMQKKEKMRSKKEDKD